MKTLINFILYQAGWFACVIGAAHGWAWWGSASGALVVIWNCTRAVKPLEELKLVALATVIGFGWDSLMVQMQLIRFVPDWPLAGVAPLWIIAVWAQFATTLNVSMRWLHRRRLFAVALGIVAAPLAYLAGQRLGALQFPHQRMALIAIALGWGAITPVLVRLAERFDGTRPLSEGLPTPSQA